MSGWAAKRFWTEATAEPVETGGFTVTLDGRGVKTPAKSPLTLPTRAMADAVAAEWQAQDEQVDPRTMPVTRAANAAIDKVAAQFDEVCQMLAEYGDSDLTCYRAESPQALVDRQAAAWDPVLDWAADRYGARLIPVQGVVHHPQPAAALARLAEPLRQMTPFELTALHDLIGLSGSLVIGLAASEGWADLGDLWSRSRIDEDWQAEQWGADEEAAETAAFKRQEFCDAARFLALSRGESAPKTDSP